MCPTPAPEALAVHGGTVRTQTKAAMPRVGPALRLVPSTVLGSREQPAPPGGGGGWSLSGWPGQLGTWPSASPKRLAGGGQES